MEFWLYIVQIFFLLLFLHFYLLQRVCAVNQGLGQSHQTNKMVQDHTSG